MHCHKCKGREVTSGRGGERRKENLYKRVDDPWSEIAKKCHIDKVRKWRGISGSRWGSP